MDIFGQTFVFFVVYDWNHTAAFASLLLGCAAISLPLMPLFGIGMTKLGLRWNGDAFPGLCRRLGPVSYTHLDVYKRQVSSTLVVRSSTRTL